jgi:hypothetical protein
VALIMRTAIIVASLASAIVLVHRNGPVDATEITCSTWQGVTTCSSPDGYVSHESTWNGITSGDDNRGGKWTSWRWRDIETTTGWR